MITFCSLTKHSIGGASAFCFINLVNLTIKLRCCFLLFYLSLHPVLQFSPLPSVAKSNLAATGPVKFMEMMSQDLLSALYVWLYWISSHPQIINISYIGQVKGFIQLRICFQGNRLQSFEQFKHVENKACFLVFSSDFVCKALSVSFLSLLQADTEKLIALTSNSKQFIT